MGIKVKGITIELGMDTSGIEKALSGANKSINATQRQLNDVNRLLKMDPGNTELLKQKFELLSGGIEQTEKKLNALKDAEKEVQKQFERGDIGEDQYNALKREIIETDIKLGKLRDESQKTEKAINGIDEKPIEEVKEAADDAGKSLKNAGKDASDFGEYLKAGAIIEGAKGIVGALKDISEESKELQIDLSRLDENARQSGVGIDVSRKAFREFALQSGETDSAIEGVANLLQAGFTESNLQLAVEGLAGAATKFPDTLKIESLADSLQETIATGAATGQFGELLDRLGIGAENFSNGMANMTTEAERQNYALETLVNAGLVDSYNAWKENNEGLTKNIDANIRMQEEMAKLGELIQPIITEVIGGVVTLLSWFNNMDPVVQQLILTMIGLAAGVGVGYTAFDKLSSLFSFITANPIVLLIAAIIALVSAIAVCGDDTQEVLQKVDDFLQGVFVKDWREVFGPILGGILNGFFAGVKDIWDALKRILDGIIDFIRGVFTGDWKRAWNGVKNIFGGIFEGLVGIAKSPLNGTIALLNMLIDGINWVIGGLNKIHFDVPDWVPGIGGKKIGVSNIGKIGSIPYLANGGKIYDGSAIVGEAGPEILTVTGNSAVVEPLTNQTTNHNIGGVNMYIYGAPGQDVEELADLISEKINNDIVKKEEAFG
jgi:putative prophage lambdaBa04, tape measure protein